MSYENPIIVLDGADGSGKTTQIELLKKSFPNCNFMKFPNYNSDTGFYITKYLEGELTHLFENMNYLDKIYKISSLYTTDRVMWFNEHYDKNKPLILDRYTTSNVLHMSTLIAKHGGNFIEIDDYINRLEFLEYEILNLPKPDMVIYLDVNTDQLLKNLNTTEKVLDVHEDITVFKKIESVKEHIFDRCDWDVINCCHDTGMRTKLGIHNDIITLIESRFPKLK